MKKLLYILLSFISIQATAQIEQPRIKFNQVIKDSTGSGRIVISSLTDSNMIYSTDFYINPTDSLLIFFGDTIVGGGTLSSVLVDSVYIYGDGSTTPIQLNIANTRDSILTRIAPGLGIDTTYVNGLLTISSLNIEEVCKNETGKTLLKGYPVYQVACSNQGNAICVDYADASNPLKMPAVGILEDNLAPGQEGKILFTGFIQGVNTSMFLSGDVIYVAVDSGYTNVKPKGENVLIQNIGRVIKVHDNNGSGIIIGAGRSNDVPNLNPNNIFIGGVDSVVTSISLPTVISDSLNNYLALSDYIVDSTRLTQDSILVYYQNGTIIRQDTISNIPDFGGAMFQQIFIADGITNQFTVTENSGNLPATDKDLLVAENGQILDKDLITLDQGNSLVILDSIPEAGSRIAVIWFDAIAINGGLDSVFTDNTITGNGLTGSPLRVDTSIIATQGDLSDYVTVAETQTITGAKTFTSALTQSGGDVNFDSGTFYVDATNNWVGIGTSSPNATLDLGIGNKKIKVTEQNITETYIEGGGVRLKNIYASGGWARAIVKYQDSSEVDYFHLGGFGDGQSLDYVYLGPAWNNNYQVWESNGDVGIGTSSPSHPLEMGSGAHVTTGGVWTDASDIKLKTNINYIYPYGLEDIMNLKPTMFDYKNGEKNSLGFIAQDIYEIIPEAISSTIDDNGNETMGVKMVSITATLTKAIQEQQAIIESQATEIEQLKSQIQVILSEIEQIKNN
jgi:hypothetical protein